MSDNSPFTKEQEAGIIAETERERRKLLFQRLCGESDLELGLKTLVVLAKVNPELFLERYKQQLNNSHYPLQELKTQGLNDLVKSGVTENLLIRLKDIAISGDVSKGQLLWLLAVVNQKEYAQLYRRCVNEGEHYLERCEAIDSLEVLARTNTTLFLELYQEGIQHSSWNTRRNVADKLGALAFADPNKFIELYGLKCCDKHFHSTEACVPPKTIGDLALADPEKYSKLWRWIVCEKNRFREECFQELPTLSYFNPKLIIQKYREDPKSYVPPTAVAREHLPFLKSPQEKCDRWRIKFFLDMYSLLAEVHMDSIAKEVAGTLGKLAAADPEKYEELYLVGLSSKNEEIRVATADTLEELALVDIPRYLRLRQHRKDILGEHYKEGPIPEELVASNDSIEPKIAARLFLNWFRSDSENIIERAKRSLVALAKDNPHAFCDIYLECRKESEDKIQTKINLANGTDAALAYFFALHPQEFRNRPELKKHLPKGRSEKPEFWLSLARVSPNKFVELYQQLNGRRLLVDIFPIDYALDGLAATVFDEELTPIEDEEHEFIRFYLKSKYVLDNEGGLLPESQIIETIQKFLWTSGEKDYARLKEITTESKAKDLEEIAECAQFEAHEIFLRRIGEGVHGTTYLVFSPTFNCEMVIKVLNDNKPEITEAKILITLDHENIVKVRYAGNFIKCRGKPVQAVLMDYVEGESLEEFVSSTSLKLYRESSSQNKNNTTSISEIVKLAIHVFNGLCYLHSEGVFHRDLNPRNIRYNRQTEEVKIIDFGIATINPEESPYPEGNTRYGGRNDLISLGQIIYKLVTGNNLFNDNSELSAQHKDTIRAERERTYSTPGELDKRMKQIEADIHHPELSGIIRDCLSASGAESSYSLVAQRFKDYINSTISLGSLRDHYSRERTLKANQWPKISSFD